MDRVVLISCCSRKLSYKAPAERLYQSTLFRLSLRYARTLDPDQIFVLSAKYGLVSLNQELEPYDVTLNDMTTQQIRSWSLSVLDQLRRISDLTQDHFTILAGQHYRRFLVLHLSNYKVPLEGLRIGEQLSYLKRIVG